MSQVLANSLIYAFAMYEKNMFSKQKIFVFENSLDNLRYQNSLDKPPKINPLDKPSIRFVRQPSDIMYWTSSDKICSKAMLCTHTHFTRCSRAYEMRNAIFMSIHVTCLMRATCSIYKSWIIIFSTYNLHPSCNPC